MKKNFWLTILTFVAMVPAGAQWVAGPMLGTVELRDAQFWLAVKSENDEVRLTVRDMQNRVVTSLTGRPQRHYDFVTCKLHAGGLEPGTAYRYELSVKPAGGKAEVRGGNFTTKTLFQWRRAPDDFTFLTGSCSYFNEPAYDRPGRPYGLDSSIFETMAKEPAAFMMWLGDNWYTREVDYASNWGLWYRAWRDRSMPVLQRFLGAMPHLAIWDDHDYGPNDYGKSFHLKQESREVFRHFWANPSYGDGREGIFTRYQYNDVDFFMLDDRWWRDYDNLPDSVNGAPNPNKRMFGRQQLDWLKEELRISQGNRFVTFRIIVTGSQVLNPASPFDRMRAFPVEYYELMDFIRDEKIEGVLFLTGDRHHSEVIRVEEPGIYPLFDITCSPLSSGTHRFGGPEANNPWRVAGVDQLQNYGRISVTGDQDNRRLQVDFVGLRGELLGSWQVSRNELKFPKP